MPKYGFTRMFENMLDHPNIKVMLNSDYQDVKDCIPFRELIFTGPVDEFFDYQYGKLPYRCLEFKHETLNQERFQPVAVVNYPNDYTFTRVTEFKHLTGQEHPKTSIVTSIPCRRRRVQSHPRKENSKSTNSTSSAEESGVHFVGARHVQVLQYGSGGGAGADGLCEVEQHESHRGDEPDDGDGADDGVVPHSRPHHEAEALPGTAGPPPSGAGGIAVGIQQDSGRQY